ncbi:MAG: hypothetical protein AUJ04_00915 [Acidobacteria bacterium 13_1_40CM_3_55_6]|nr:MAG: hypothetical protein AUJ04_00915 [Acidobacteria bacterium 13_1_40CM_3_55_6]
MTLTIELPDLVGEFQKEQIPDEELKAVVIAALEVWLEQRQAANAGRLAESAVPFTRRLLERNRQLFEALAQR